MIRTLLLSTLVVSLAAAELRGQTLWSLHDCMVYAVENAPKYKIQEATNQNNNRDVRDATLGLLPSVSGSASGGYNSGRVISQEDNTYVNMTVFSSSYGLNAQLPLFNGFQAVSKLKMARVAKWQGIEESQRIEDELALTTMQAYFNVMHAYGMVNLAREQFDENNQRLKDIQIRAELGLKGQADVLQAEADVASSDYNLTQQQNTWAENLLQLKEAMFYPIEKELMIDTTLRPRMNLLGERESRDSITRTALAFLPEAKKAAFNVESAKYRFQSARLQLFPTLSMSGSYGSRYYNSSNLNIGKQYQNNLSKYLGLSMSVPLFSGLSRQSNITRTRNQMRIAGYQQDETRQQIEAAVQRAIQEMEGRGKEYIQALKTVLAEEGAHAVNKRKYAEGLISILDLQTSMNRLLESRVKQLNAMLLYQIKRREVDYYKGTPYIDQEF